MLAWLLIRRLDLVQTENEQPRNFREDNPTLDGLPCSGINIRAILGLKSSPNTYVLSDEQVGFAFSHLIPASIEGGLRTCRPARNDEDRGSSVESFLQAMEIILLDPSLPGLGTLSQPLPT